MRVINLVLHIVTMVLLAPNLLFVGINFLWGMQYLKGLETLIVPLVVLFFVGAFFASMILGPVQCIRYRSTRPNAYMIQELFIHGLSAICFLIMIVYSLVIICHHGFRVPELSLWATENSISVIDLTGVAVCLAGIIITIVGSRIRKKSLAKAASDASYPA